jgi:hypothetical protein
VLVPEIEEANFERLLSVRHTQLQEPECQILSRLQTKFLELRLEAFEHFDMGNLAAVDPLDQQCRSGIVAMEAEQQLTGYVVAHALPSLSSAQSHPSGVLSERICGSVPAHRSTE